MILTLAGIGVATTVAGAFLAWMFIRENVVLEAPRGPKLEVDNRTAASMAVTLDGAPLGTVAAFQVNSFDASPGTRAVVVTSGGKELDRAEIAFKKAKTVVYCPRGDGRYTLERVRYYPPPRRMDFARAGDLQRTADHKILEADFGVTEAVPPTIVMSQGKSVEERVKVLWRPPLRFSPEEAVAFLLSQRDRSDYDPDSRVAAFRAALKAPDRSRGIQAAVQFLETELNPVSDDVLLDLWRAPIEISDATLVAWLDPKEEAKTSFRQARTSHAALLLFDRGRGSAVAPHAARVLEVFKSAQPQRILPKLPPARACRVFRGMIDLPAGPFANEALRAAQNPNFVPDADTLKAVDAFIAKLPSEGNSPISSRHLWIRARSGMAERLSAPGGGTPEERIRFAASLPGGARQDSAFAELLREERHGALAEAYPGLNSTARRSLFKQLVEQISREGGSPTPGQLKILDVAFSPATNGDLSPYPEFVLLLGGVGPKPGPEWVAALEGVISRQPAPTQKQFRTTLADLLKPR